MIKGRLTSSGLNWPIMPAFSSGGEPYRAEVFHEGPQSSRYIPVTQEQGRIPASRCCMASDHVRHKLLNFLLRLALRRLRFSQACSHNRLDGGRNGALPSNSLVKLATITYVGADLHMELKGSFLPIALCAFALLFSPNLADRYPGSSTILPFKQGYRNLVGCHSISSFLSLDFGRFKSLFEIRFHGGELIWGHT